MNAPAVYADVPYSNHPHAQSRPDLLATIGALHGRPAVPPSRARVLELGCNAGGNLIGMAYAHPGMQAVGIDYAPTAIEVARRTVGELGLRNARFEVADIRAVADEPLGEFDYVLSHGIYAWVPPDVRDALLAAVKAHLVPDGLAYVSYNTEPGGHLRRILREAAFWHARDTHGPVELAESARELFAALREALGGEEADGWWGTGLETELNYLAQAPDSIIVHDLLADGWEPVWFADFAAHAQRHGLGYLGPARLDELRRLPVAEEGARLLDELSGDDPVRRGHITDLITFRRFRESVLCHAGGPPPREPDPTVLDQLSFALAPGETADDDPPEVVAVRAALLEHWPLGMDWGELSAATGLEHGALRTALFDAFRRGLANPHVELPALARPGPRPHVSALVRLHAAAGTSLTTLYNGMVHVGDPLSRALLVLMDGTRDREQVLADFRDVTGRDVTAEVLERNIELLGRLPLFHS